MKKKVLIFSIIGIVLIGVLVTVLFLLRDTDSPNKIVTPEEQTEEMYLDKTTLVMQVSGSEVLTVMNTDQKAVFVSADSAVATVSDDGTVKAVAVGQTKITCKVGSKEFVCSVFVCRKGAPKESFDAPDTDDFAACLGNSGGYVGEYAAVTLYLWNKAPLSGFSLTLSYDSDILSLCKADFVGVGMDAGEVYAEDGKLTLAALSHKTNGIATANGAVPAVLLVFKIEGATGKQKLPLELSLADGDMFVSVKDGKEVLITPTLYDGGIEIKK